MKKIYLLLMVCFSFCYATIAFAQPGVLDQTFGVNGRSFMPDTVLPVDIKIQPDQKILVLSMFGRGYFSDGYSLTRFKPNGILDSTFGINGRHTVMDDQQPYALAIQPDGKILVSSTYNSDTLNQPPSTYTGYDYNLTRYMSNGSIDNSFGTNGKVITNFSSSGNYLTDRPTSVFVLPNGKIIQGGYS